MVKVGLVRVLTVTSDKALKSQEEVILKNYAGIEITSRCILDQPEGIYDDKTEQIAIPKILKLAKDFEQEGYDLVYISCAADPGVRECRTVLKIPVIGAGSCCASMAVSLGQHIGVLGITAGVPKVMQEIIGERFVKIIKPAGVSSVLDILVPGGAEKCISSAKELAESGCDVIALACAGFSTLGIYKEIKKQTGLIVIDPVMAAGGVIAAMRPFI
ncbi:MAG: aspartate/glutamate racemase family protein [Peptococcaceae bacterium]